VLVIEHKYIQLLVIERQVAIKFARFLQISLSSLLNNHINLFLSDNSGKKMHKLEIERGRYTIPKTAVENRICKQCNCEAVED
jgi:hypothetical protein